MPIGRVVAANGCIGKAKECFLHLHDMTSLHAHSSLPESKNFFSSLCILPLYGYSSRWKASAS